MAGRKPPGITWESWIDQVIREGRERGEFDHLPGHGKPLTGLGDAHDDLWWVRKKLRDEGVSFLPPTLALRKDREDTLASLDCQRSEASVRQTLEELNARIRSVNRLSIEGPPSNVMPVDIEEMVDAWRLKRAEAVEAAEVIGSPTEKLGASSPAVRDERSPRPRSARILWWRNRTGSTTHPFSVVDTDPLPG